LRAKPPGSASRRARFAPADAGAFFFSDMNHSPCDCAYGVP
jgi:hypothetical protein